MRLWEQTRVFPSLPANPGRNLHVSSGKVSAQSLPLLSHEKRCPTGVSRESGVPYPHFLQLWGLFTQLTGPGQTACFQGCMSPGLELSVMDFLVWPFSGPGSCEATPTFMSYPVTLTEGPESPGFLACVIYRCGGSVLWA